jgi:hypothetical protein
MDGWMDRRTGGRTDGWMDDITSINIPTGYYNVMISNYSKL